MVTVGPYDIVLIPESNWGKSLTDLAYRKGSAFRGQWDRIMKREVARAEGKCEFCGGTGGRLVVHEEWEFDENTLTQRLKGYRVTCRDCNLILHAGRTPFLEYLEDVKDHFEKVTGLNSKELTIAALTATAEWKARSAKKWRLDVSFEPLAKGFEEMVNQRPAKTRGP